MVSLLASHCQFQPDINLLRDGDEDGGLGESHDPKVRGVFAGLWV